MTTLAQLNDCHSCNDERSIVQKKKWGQSGGRRFTGLGVQDPELFGASGRRRREKGEEISCDNISVSSHKRETNFRIEGTEDLWKSR